MKKLLTAFAALSVITLLSANLPGDTDKSIAKVNQYKGIYFFIDCQPMSKYTVLETAFVYPQFSILSDGTKDLIVKKTVEFQNLEYNGVIVSLLNPGYKLEAIKFK